MKQSFATASSQVIESTILVLTYCLGTGLTCFVKCGVYTSIVACKSSLRPNQLLSCKWILRVGHLLAGGICSAEALARLLMGIYDRLLNRLKICLDMLLHRLRLMSIRCLWSNRLILKLLNCAHRVDTDWSQVLRVCSGSRLFAHYRHCISL